MKIVDIREIPPNAVLARTIYNENGVALLNEGTVITDEIVEKLTGNDIHSLWIRMEKQEINTFSSESIDSDVRNHMEQAINNRIHFNDKSEMKNIAEEAYGIINNIIEDENVMQCMVNIKRKSNDIYSHMISVSVLSVVMGIKIGLNDEQLKNTGMGALLHDIGLCDMSMNYFDTEIDNKDSQDKMSYRRHVIQGYELLNSYSWVPEIVKLIVLSHHEREDGSGYPFHKKSERIPIEVKVVAICDYFDELVNGIGFKKRKTHEVVEYLRTAGTYLFDYGVVSKIIASVAWFPNGSQVITNEGDVAEVISQNKGLPDRPIIRLVKDANGNPYQDEIVKDLTEFLTVFITDTVE